LISLQRLLTVAVILVATWLLARLLRLALQRLAKRFNRYRMLISGIMPVVNFTIWFIAIGFVVFGVLGLPESAIVGLIASVGVGSVVGAQDVLKNALSGTFMLINRPFQMGDMVELAGHYGEVVGIGIYATRLRTFNDNIVVIPNGQVATQAVSNANAGELHEMVVIPFDLPATVDVRTVTELAWEAAACSPYSYLKEPILVMVEDRFQRTLLTRFTVKVYAIDLRLEKVLASDIITRIKRVLLARDIVNEKLVLALLAEGHGGTQAD
jgi:small-conductance mechanosensitive channel